jgi:hypothetical protein
MSATRHFLGDPAGWEDVQIHLASLQGLWGGWRIFVFGSLDAIVQRISPATREQRYRLGLSEDEFRLLLEACIENDLLSVPPPQRPGHPDETMLQITLVNPAGESRTGEKWAGDKLEPFDLVFRRIFSLTDRTKDLLPFYTGPFDWSVSPLSPPPDRPGEREV